MNLLKEIGDAKSVAISGHIRPDGDCIGSCMAAALYIKAVRVPGTDTSDGDYRCLDRAVILSTLMLVILAVYLILDLLI